MRLDPELKAVTEDLYRVFSLYPLPVSTGPCICCHQPDDERVLLETPLRSLTPAQLLRYADDALFVWGDVPTFKHFLPRIFELLVAQGKDALKVEPQVVFAKLRLGEWLNWPEEETGSCRSFLQGTWREVLDRWHDEIMLPDIGDWLCGIGQAENDLARYLQYWLTADSISAHRNLAHIILWKGWVSPQLRAPDYWADRREQYLELQAWLRLPAVAEKLEQGALRWADQPFAEELFEAARILRP